MMARFKLSTRLWLVLPPLLAAPVLANARGAEHPSSGQAGTQGAGLLSADGTAYELYGFGFGFGVAILPRDWTRGPQALRLQAGRGQNVRVLATGTISEAGDVRLTLPQRVSPTLAVSGLNAPELLEGDTSKCSGQIRSSDGSARFVEGHLTFGDSEPLYPLRSTDDLLDYDHRNSGSGFLVYSDRATTISGRRTCIYVDAQRNNQSTLREHWQDVSVARGWNTLRLNIVTAASPAEADATLTAIPLPVGWFAFEKRP